MNCVTTNGDTLKIRAIRQGRAQRPAPTIRAYKALLQERATLLQRFLDPIQSAMNLRQ